MTKAARRAMWAVAILVILVSALWGYRHFVYLKPMRDFLAALEDIETERNARTALGDPIRIVSRGNEDAYSRTFECWVPEIPDHVLVYSRDVYGNGMPLAVFLYVDSDGRITRRLMCGS